RRSLWPGRTDYALSIGFHGQPPFDCGGNVAATAATPRRPRALAGGRRAKAASDRVVDAVHEAGCIREVITSWSGCSISKAISIAFSMLMLVACSMRSHICQGAFQGRFERLRFHGLFAQHTR